MDSGDPRGNDGSSQAVKGTAGIWYVIDERDRLVEASDGYFGFAGNNEFPGASSCLGKPLWDSISGSTTLLVQKSLLRRVRRSGRTLALPFRCDGPSVRRELTLKIATRAAVGWIQFSALPISEEQRPWQPLLDPHQSRDDRTIAMCSWCDRVRVGLDWLEIERVPSDLGLTGGGDMPRVIYYLCTRCSGMLSRA